MVPLLVSPGPPARIQARPRLGPLVGNPSRMEMKLAIQVRICRQTRSKTGFRLVIGDRFHWFKTKAEASAALLRMLGKFKLAIEPAPKRRPPPGGILYTLEEVTERRGVPQEGG